MLAELLAAVRSLADDARAPGTLAWGDPRKVLVFNHGSQGSAEERELPPPDRGHCIRGLTDFCSHVLDKEVCPSPEVYFCATHAAAYHDREDRRELSTLTLVRSDRWAALQTIDAEELSGNPSKIVEWCRKNLAGTGIEAVLAALERIDFVRAGQSHAGAGRGQESLGQSVEAKVQGIDRIPESFNLKLSPWSNPGAESIVVTVQVALYIAAGEQRIDLYVLPDSIPNAERSAVGQLREFLSDRLGDVPLFCGTP